MIVTKNNRVEVPRQMNADEIAELLNVSRNVVRKWTRDGVLPAPVRIGRRLLRWDAEKIAEWLASGCPHAQQGKQ